MWLKLDLLGLSCMIMFINQVVDNHITFYLQGLSCTLGVIVCIITLHFISFTEPFLYSGWEYQGADVDEEEEDMEADAAAAEEEEEEGGEEVSSKGDNSRI